jgi:hypothetical protein
VLPQPPTGGISLCIIQDKGNRDVDSATNMNAILGSADPGGANIRVTEADRGPGAYVSTDSDNFYGPHGVTFDPRDLHQLPLSSSLDNTREVTSERSSEGKHHFRAMKKPIMLDQGRQAGILIPICRHHGAAKGAAQPKASPRGVHAWRSRWRQGVPDPAGLAAALRPHARRQLVVLFVHNQQQYDGGIFFYKHKPAIFRVAATYSRRAEGAAGD